MKDKMSRLSPRAQARIMRIAAELNITPQEVVRRAIGIYDFLDQTARTGNETERLIANTILGRRKG